MRFASEPSRKGEGSGLGHDALVDELRFGRQYRALRIRLRRRQVDVSNQCGLSRSEIAAIDRGELAGVTIGSLRKATAALGADVDLFLRWRGERLDRLLDKDHAAIVEVFVARLRKGTWLVDVEASFSIWGERRSIDVLAFHPTTRALLVVEVKSVVPDSQATLHGLDRKARLAPDVARNRGWDVGSVSRLLVIGDSATSRRRIARLQATYDVKLPDRGTAVRRWLKAPTGSIRGLLFLSYDSRGGRKRGTGGRERVRRPRPTEFALQ